MKKILKITMSVLLSVVITLSCLETFASYENLYYVMEPTNRYSHVSSPVNGYMKVRVGDYPECKYGLITVQGKEIIPCIYDFVSPFHNGLARVGLYEDGNSDNVMKYGYVNTSAEVVIPIQFDYADDFSEGLAAAGDLLEDQYRQRDHLNYGYINTDGEFVIPKEYSCNIIAFTPDDFNSGVASVCIDKTTIWNDFTKGLVLIDKSGREICSFDSVTSKVPAPDSADREGSYTGSLTKSKFCEGLMPVKINGLNGYIDNSGKEVIPCMYDAVEDFDGGIARVIKDGKYGFINAANEIVIPFEYDYLQKFSEGLCSAQINGKWGFIDINNNIVIPFEYGYVNEFSDGLSMATYEVEYNFSDVGTFYTGKYGFINKNNEVIVPFEYSENSVDFDGGIAAVDRGYGGMLQTDYKAIDVNGNEILPPEGCSFSFSKWGQDPIYDGIVRLYWNSRMGFSDASGKELIPCIFKPDDNGDIFDDNGYRVVQLYDTDEYAVIRNPHGCKIGVTLNGVPIEFDQSPITENDRTLVPMRAIFEAMGAKVDWNEEEQTVTATKDNNNISIKIGDNTMTKNGSEIALDVSAKVIEGRTLVPVRAVAEAFETTVNWNEAARMVEIIE